MMRVRLENLAEVVTTCAPSVSFSAPFPYIDIASVDRESKRIQSVALLDPASAPSRARQKVRTGDVLVSTVRPNLNAVALVEDQYDAAIASTGFTVLRPRKGHLDSAYLFHWVRTPQFIADMTRQSTGASYPAVSDSIVKKSTIPLPPFEEQKRIAGVLDKVDGIRRKCEQTIKLADEFLRSLFLDMFGDPCTNPKNVPTRPLGQNLTFLTSGSRGWAQHYSSEGARFIRSLDVRMNKLDDDNAVYVAAPKNAEAERCRVQKGDVLLTITGSRIGRVAPVVRDPGESYISQHVAILRLNERLLPEYLSAFLALEQGGQMQIARSQYGQTKPGLNLEQIREFAVPVPELSAQHRYVSAQRSIRAIQLKLEYFQKEHEIMTRSITARAFAGEL